MSYGTLLSDEARDALVRLPIPVRRFTLRQLENLGQSPTTLSSKSHFPYREKCQVFSFDYDYQMQRWAITVLFQYGQDEQTIHVLAIGFNARDPWDGAGLTGE